MRILHVLLSKGFSGTERSTAESCNFQVVDHDTTLVVQLSPGRWKWGRDASILNNLHRDVRVRRMPRRLFAKGILQALVARLRPDIIHAHLEEAIRLTAALDTAAVKVATLHMDDFIPELASFDGLVSIARWQERLIPASFKGQLFHCPNSIVPHPTVSPGEVLKLRQELGVGPHDYLIGGVGTLIMRKGWDTLIRAFREADMPPDARLVIIGDGRDRPCFEALADERVLLPGFRKNVKDYYQAFDLFVCPSRREAFGRVLLEALDAGTPIVAADAEGCSEIVSTFGGDLFPRDDVAALAQLLSRHARERRPRSSVDLSAHSIESSGRELVKIYHTLHDARSNPAGRPVEPVPAAQDRCTSPASRYG